MNGPTIIVLSIVVVIFLAIVIKQIRDRKAGKCSCSCSGSCSTCGGCCGMESNTKSK